MLNAQAEAVLRANWRTGSRRDGVPFDAIAWTHVDRARAKAELRTLLRAGSADGFIPHTAFWQASPRWRRAPLYATHHFRGDTGTASIQTPLLAVAWERVAAGDDAFREEGLEALAAHARWLIAERDPDGDGLLTILLPDESGLDDSPKYDGVYGSLAHYKPGYARLVQRCRRAGWSAAAITRIRAATTPASACRASRWRSRRSAPASTPAARGEARRG